MMFGVFSHMGNGQINVVAVQEVQDVETIN